MLELLKGAVDSLIITSEGERGLKITTTYMTCFPDFVIKRGNTTLFDRSSEEFPKTVV